MLPRLLRRRVIDHVRSRLTTPQTAAQRRWMTPAPKPGDGPLLSRRADRELPDITGASAFRWGRTLPIFAAIITVSSLAIFNYQKVSSPVVSSTLYALRVSPTARELLGDEIQFRHSIPWIRGQMNQIKGRIDISVAVKGTRGNGTMRFASHRPTHKGLFKTTAWELTLEDGTRVDMLDGGDPFAELLAEENPMTGHVERPAGGVAAMDEDALTRGFRQQKTLR